MSNFNEYFKRQGAGIIVNRFFSGADSFNPKYKISSLRYEIVEEPPRSASYYTENGLTATHVVRVFYTLNDSPEELTTEFEIPKEIDGVFIIEGSFRVATNQLGSDYDCRIKMSGTGDYVVNFDYDRRYDIQKQVLKFKKSTLEDEPAKPNDRGWQVAYDEIDNLTGRKKEFLKLTEKQSKKLQVKLDLDYVPEYINTRLIQQCIAFGDDRVRDLVVDKTIESVSSGFMKFMFRSSNGRNYFAARRQINTYFSKFNKLQDQTNSITRLAFRFFKGTQEAKSGDSNLRVPPGINAMNLQSWEDVIAIPETCAYNATMSDLIDIADTPINANTNLQNALTVSTHVTDEGILFDVFSKDFQRMTIPYLDYLNSKVCASEYVDYKKKQLKPNEKGEVEVKYRMKRVMVPVGEVDLVDLHPDYRLSRAMRRVPLINFTDSVRLMMGSSMLKQAIPLVNAQRPLVDTGLTEELADNSLNEKFKYKSGKVVGIDDDSVTIRLDDKEKTEVKVLRRTAIQSQNNISVYTEPKVKVGQKVKEGDIITGAVGLEKDTYKAGVNAMVLFSAYKGLVNEDALVVSESFADRMRHYSIIDLNFNVKNSTALKWIAPIGTKVKSGDEIATLFRAVRLDEINRTLTEKLGGLFGEEGKDLTEYTVEDQVKVPNNIDDAWVSDVYIQEQKKPSIPKSVKAPDYTFSKQSAKVIKEYEEKKNREIIYKKFPEYIAADTLDPVNMNPKDYKIVYTVRVRLIKKTGLMKGSKVTNRYGGKGVISAVIPDELMPVMVDKTSGKQTRIEVIMNPYSTINRKIAGVLIEQNLGLIANKVHSLVDEYKTSAAGKKKILPLVNKYYSDRYADMSVEEFIKLHDSKPIEEIYYFNVGCYSDYTPELVDKWMDELGLESQSEILAPEETVTDLEELKANLSEEEYDEIVKSMKGKLVPIRKKLQVGPLNLLELYHIPTYSNKVTTSMFDADINPKRNEPILGHGRYRETGQKIGEQELAILLSRNNKTFLNSVRAQSAQEDNQTFLNSLLGLGLSVVGDDGYLQGGSSLKSEMKGLKTKFKPRNRR